MGFFAVIFFRGLQNWIMLEKCRVLMSVLDNFAAIYFRKNCWFAVFFVL